MTGITDPALPLGYSFDYINAEVIKGRVKVKDNKMVLPDGMSYSLLVLPRLETMRPELLRKIKDLVAEGANVLGPEPSRSPSLQGYPSADADVKKLAAELWGSVDGKNVKSGTYGKGRVFSGMDMQSVLNMLNISPDFDINSKEPVLYIHRSTPHEEIYFVSNQSEKLISFSPTFRVKGRQPEFWDPVNGTTRILPVFSETSGGTTVPLKLEPLQSAFIIFRKSVTNSTAVKINFPDAQLISSINSPWTVSFDQKMRGPQQPVVFKQLTDWIERKEENIKYYSGTAVYRNAFQVTNFKTGQRIYLNLGEVKVMAKVKVNGIDVGGAWTAPWRVDITDAIKSGMNQIEISVVNTWVNRLIGDSKLPESQRKTWTSYPLYNPKSPLEPSGLKGTVTVTSIQY
jgi:hypothetical protein